MIMTAAISFKVTNMMKMVLPPVVVYLSYALLSNLGLYSTDRFVLGSGIATAFVFLAVESLYTATIANSICVIEQQNADEKAIPGSKEAMRQKGEVELASLAMLGYKNPNKKVD